MIKEEVFVHRLPEYYNQHKGNTGQFDIQQAIDEAVKRGYHATDLGIAEKHISEVLKKYLPKGIVGMSEVKYVCYDSGVILLAPYKRKGAIIGFLDYRKMAALEDTISRIISYRDGSTLPEGFVLMNDRDFLLWL